MLLSVLEVPWRWFHNTPTSSGWVPLVLSHDPNVTYILQLRVACYRYLQAWAGRGGWQRGLSRAWGRAGRDVPRATREPSGSTLPRVAVCTATPPYHLQQYTHQYNAYGDNVTVKTADFQLSWWFLLKNTLPTNIDKYFLQRHTVKTIEAYMMSAFRVY